MMAMPVPVVSVVKKTLPIYLDYPGRIESIRSIALRARVSGYIDSQPAVDGADVKSGDLLHQIDPRDLQAALDQANAQAQRDQASLEYARASFARGEELVRSGFVAKDVYDHRASAMRQGEAALMADRAAIEAAKLNLSYAEIRAPFSGRLAGIWRRKARSSARRPGRSTRWFSLIRFMSRSTQANPSSPTS
jgi:membrane fusion protein, multidrug efflux system